MSYSFARHKWSENIMALFYCCFHSPMVGVPHHRCQHLLAHLVPLLPFLPMAKAEWRCPQHCLPKPAVLAWLDWRWCSALRWRLFCPSTDGDWIRGNERKKEPAQNHRHKSQQGLESAAWGRKQPSSPHLRTQLSLLQGRKNHTQERGPCFLLSKPSTIILKVHYYSKESTLPLKLLQVLLLLGN